MQDPGALNQAVDEAAQAIAQADAILVGAGAGMGVDSGLPDFRGDAGFWKAYPRYAELGLRFAELANPRWFTKDPELAWGFYGHRLHLYRETRPHRGFDLLRAFASELEDGLFALTSNVDGQFQRAGFPAGRVVEIHGSIHFMQCLGGCDLGAHPADPYRVELDDRSLRARPPLPSCPRCGGLLRPNILMFNDSGWDSARSDAQEAELSRWLHEHARRGSRFAVIELGAGRAIPSVRRFCAGTARELRAPLLRVNPRESEADPYESGYQHIALPTTALDGLQRIAAALATSRAASPDT